MSQNYKHGPDYYLLFIIIMLLSVGLLMVFSTSPMKTMRMGDSYYYLKRHMIALFAGLVFMYGGYRLDISSLKRFSGYVIGSAFILLLMVLVPGIGIKTLGASRWINMGIFSFQPTELAKLAVIIYLAKELSEADEIGQKLFPQIGVLLAMLYLIYREPDMGTMIVISAIAFCMFFLAGARIKHILSVIVGGVIGIGVLSKVAPYRVARFATYWNPWKDARGAGYNIVQSLIAVGSGGITGLGLGGSKQKFFYLPENYTDFIFAIFCEEMGLFGALGLVLLFFLLVARGIKIIRNAPDNFSMLLAGGIVCWIGFQAFLNMSVVVGLLPTTGIPLPFISYGGTSIVMLLFANGLLLNISRSGGST